MVKTCHMDKKKREKLYREHSHEIFKMIDETITQYPIRICVTDEEIEEYQKELNDFWQVKKEEIRKRFIEMGFELKDNDNPDDNNNVKENKLMDTRVAKFLTEIMNGTEPNTAIDNSGVGEMKLREVLIEIAGVWNVNILEELINYPNWNEVSDKITDYQKLRETLNTIKEMDESLNSLRENATESN